MCECLGEVCKALAEHNATVETKGMIDFATGTVSESPPMIVVSKIDPNKRKPLSPLFCSYCPFCGKKYT